MAKKTRNYDVSELIYFLGRKESYPHPVDKVEHIQTHISHVFIAGPFVYKLKKPVDFGFLDYSTLQKRKKYCHREVELNRRLSDDIYIGVVGISRKGSHYSFDESETDSDETIEYVVKMRKMQGDYFLNRIIEEGKLTNKHLDRVADFLTPFYLNQNQDRDLSKWGKIETIKFNTDENFSQTEQFIGHSIHRNAFEAVRYFTDCYFQKNKQLFQSRIKNRRIVDGHGDLHLEHIHITPEKVQIYDCIEFNERFRYGDLAADLAFLAMDLDFNHCMRQERYFVEMMSEKLKDKELPQIIDFYKCYRAYVKGKVKSLQSVEEEVPKQNRKLLKEKAVRYFNLSLRYALIGSKPIVIVFMGRIATGKSTLAEALSKQLKIDLFSSDRVRKSLAGLPLTERTPASKRSSLYSSGMSEKTYETLISKAKDSIDNGESVIVDATFNKQEFRQLLQDCFKGKAISLLFVEVQASDEAIYERLKARNTAENVISDARLEDFEKLAASYTSPSEMNFHPYITAHTDQPLENSLEQLYKKMIDNHLETIP